MDVMEKVINYILDLSIRLKNIFNKNREIFDSKKLATDPTKFNRLYLGILYFLDNIFGRCCGGGQDGGGCGGYVGGKSALTYYKESFFGSPKITTWKRGEPAVVYWNSHAFHRGGYAFRLCKVKNGKIWKVTEECFQIALEICW